MIWMVLRGGPLFWLARDEKRFSFYWALGFPVTVRNCFLISGKTLHAEDEKDNPFGFSYLFFRTRKTTCLWCCENIGLESHKLVEMEILCLGEIYSEPDP